MGGMEVILQYLFAYIMKGISNIKHEKQRASYCILNTFRNT